MTAYVVSATGAAPQISVMPGSLSLRVARVEVNGLAESIGSTAGDVGYTVAVYPSSTATGGTSFTPFPFRMGSTAATATAKVGATVSGTSVLIHGEATQVYTTSTSIPVFTYVNSGYNFPFDLILTSGSTVHLHTYSDGGNFNSVALFFEELRVTGDL